MLARPTSTISSVLLIGIVIAVFAYLQAITDSAFNTMSGTGDDNTIIVMSQQADAETVSGLTKEQLNKLEGAPAVVRKDAGAVMSSEMVAIASAKTRASKPGVRPVLMRWLFPSDSAADDVQVNVSVRGVDFDVANAVRDGSVRILPDGRVFSPGTFECIVGASAARLYRDYEVGQEIQLGNRGLRLFKIVGIFDTGGTASDSEVWAYVESMRDVYGRSGYSSARLLVPDQTAAKTAIEYISGPTVELNAKTERDYFREMETGQTATRVMSLILIVIMGIAAAFAIANTMYAAVAGRMREIGMLRAVGFGRASILAAFVVEGVTLATLGGLLGCGLSLLWNGQQQNILPQTFTTVTYSLQLTPKILGVSLAVAVAIGLLGSLLPATRAARMNVVQSLRDA